MLNRISQTQKGNSTCFSHVWYLETTEKKKVIGIFLGMKNERGKEDFESNTGMSVIKVSFTGNSIIRHFTLHN